MDLMYQSLGGDGYISPGRRSYHPSTDLRDNPHKHRLARYSLTALTILILTAAATATFLFTPRPLTSAPTGSGSAASYYTLSAEGRVLFAFNHTLPITNTNYYTVPLHSATLTFTLPPLSPPSPAPYNSSGPVAPVPGACYGAVVLGGYEVDGGDVGGVGVGALETGGWVVSGVVEGVAGGEVVGCVREWCRRGGGYEVWMDALVRVSYVGLAAAVVVDTVTVDVACPTGRHWDAETVEVER